ncbi:uncharacterized protein LOC143198163 [Rhynchophorus ferrugineus]|uniref:uncharacterized protein LOC143198163 n=1 Tax=Rhynchophorus ferrugineus TaxID=354439 RepID=UPI003FCCE1F2
MFIQMRQSEPSYQILKCTLQGLCIHIHVKTSVTKGDRVYHRHLRRNRPFRWMIQRIAPKSLYRVVTIAFCKRPNFIMGKHTPQERAEIVSEGYLVKWKIFRLN